MRKWIVLIGPPAVGKSTFSLQLQTCLNAKVYSFDKEFPSIVDGSKNARKAFLEMIQADEQSEWIVVDDTCHFRSMQKRYILESERQEYNSIKILFLYISARNDQISELQERNLQRETKVTSVEIDKMTRFLNSSKIKLPNVIEYNYANIPGVEVLMNDIKCAFDNYKERIHANEHAVDVESEANFWNRLNLALNKEISEAFKSNPKHLDGKQVSATKKAFISDVKSDQNIDDLVELFRENHLF